MVDEVIPTPEMIPDVPIESAVQTPDEKPEVTVEVPAETKIDTLLTPPEAKEEIKLKEEGEPEKADKTDEAKSVEEKEGEQSAEPALSPTYDAFQLPEGMSLPEERISDIHKVLGEFESKTKADHAEVQSLGQAFVDRHIAAVQKLIQDSQNAVEQRNESWREAFDKDPEIGGNRRDTTLTAAHEFIRTHGGTSEQQAEIYNILKETGAGNHPSIVRLLAQAAKSNEFSEGKPLPATSPAPLATNKIQKRYGTN